MRTNCKADEDWEIKNLRAILTNVEYSDNSDTDMSELVK